MQRKVHGFKKLCKSKHGGANERRGKQEGNGGLRRGGI